MSACNPGIPKSQVSIACESELLHWICRSRRDAPPLADDMQSLAVASRLAEHVQTYMQFRLPKPPEHHSRRLFIWRSRCCFTFRRLVKHFLVAHVVLSLRSNQVEIWNIKRGLIECFIIKPWVQACRQCWRKYGSC